jgi:hypothetical protein
VRSSILLRTAAPLTLCAACASSAPPPDAPPPGRQTFADAVKMICDVDQLAGLSPEEDVLVIGQKRSQWIEGHVEHPDGIYLRTVLSVKPAEEQAAEMRSQAQKVGLARCTLADSIAATGTGALSP